MSKPATPPHDGKLGLGGVSLTMARVPKYDLDAMQLVTDQIEPIMEESGYLLDAPFSWVTLMIRYGLKNEEKPHYMAINRKFGDLPLAIEVDVHEMLGASLEELHNIFKRASLLALIHAGQRYDRPVESLKKMLEE
ncbi:Imm39 family immunity protein [uncultured Erythrobacter sp.]|uniref:Imm39 family immunity protein n=1 Tax=uncultured Erythrobacter sp. TaxID=263913 RepID=UPI0026105B94|nr:Imm39 family immunity protein [uncultured Erythrobacter sp.]